MINAHLCRCWSVTCPGAPYLVHLHHASRDTWSFVWLGCNRRYHLSSATGIKIFLKMIALHQCGGGRSVPQRRAVFRLVLDTEMNWRGKVTIWHCTAFFVIARNGLWPSHNFKFYATCLLTRSRPVRVRFVTGSSSHHTLPWDRDQDLWASMYHHMPMIRLSPLSFIWLRLRRMGLCPGMGRPFKVCVSIWPPWSLPAAGEVNNLRTYFTFWWLRRHSIFSNGWIDQQSSTRINSWLSVAPASFLSLCRHRHLFPCCDYFRFVGSRTHS
jgi:hypothetical protein